jgi:hypothetical protein
MRRLRKFLRLTSCDRHLLITAALLMSAIRLGLWLLPFRVLRQVVKSLTAVRPAPQQISINQVVWAVEVASGYMPGGVKCLARALTTQILLSRRGYSTELRIGVAKNQQGQLEAHAWVESQGSVIIGELADLTRFTPLPNLEGKQA